MSDVTDILTARINVKRLTNLLLDGITPSSASAVDRQPARSSRLEIEIWGATIATLGTVIIENTDVVSLNQYVFQDVSTADKWAMTIDNGVVALMTTINAADVNPILQDSLNPSNYWVMTIDNGIVFVGATSTIQADEIGLRDQTTLLGYELVVTDGVPGISSLASAYEQFVFTQNDVKVGTEDFTNIGSVFCTGIAGGSISIRSINNMGQPINQLVNVGTDVPVRFYAQSGRIRMMKQGQDKIAKYKIMAEPDADIEDNDMIYAVSGIFGLTYGKVEFAERIYDFDGLTHHLEAEIMDL